MFIVNSNRSEWLEKYSTETLAAHLESPMTKVCLPPVEVDKPAETVCETVTSN